MPNLNTEQLTLAYESNTIIDSLTLSIPQGQVTALIGANGCGKSTLLRSMARLLAPKQGRVLLDGKAIATMGSKDVAKQLGILPQSPTAPEGLTVRELVAQGRYPHQSWLSQWSDDDARMVDRALSLTGMKALANRPLEALSGGQRQRAWIAMALAQDTPLILLDEPTTYLDLSHQIEVLDLLWELNSQEGRTIVMVIHDLNHACRYAHHLVALKGGKIYAQGEPYEIMSEQLVKEVFNMDCRIIPDPVSGTPLVVPVGRNRCPLLVALGR